MNVPLTNAIATSSTLEDYYFYIPQDGSFMDIVKVKNNNTRRIDYLMTPYGLTPFVDDNQQQADYHKRLSHGSVRISDIYSSNRTNQTIVNLWVISANSKKDPIIIEQPIDDIRIGSPDLKQALIRNGVDICSNSAFSQIIRFLNLCIAFFSTVHFQNNGFYINEDNRLSYKDSELVLKALESDQHTSLSIRSDQTGALNSQLLLALSIWGLDSIKHLSQYEIPEIFVVSSDPISATESLQNLFGVPKIPNPQRLNTNHISSQILLCDMTLQNNYMRQKAVRILNEISHRNTVVAVISKPEDVQESISSLNAVFILFEVFGIENGDSLRAAMIRSLIKTPDILRQVRNGVAVENSFLDEMQTVFASHVLAIAKCFLESLFNEKKDAEAYLHSFSDYLENNLDLIDPFGSRIIRQYLKEGSYLTAEKSSINMNFYHSEGIAYTRSSLYFMPSAMKSAADMGNVSREALCSDLKANGVLTTQTKNQVKLHINGSEFRAYEISQDKLYKFFEPRFETGDMKYSRPELKFCIGEAGEKKLYFNSYEKAEDRDLHVAVFGVTGSGKTVFLRHFVLQAARNDCLCLAVSLKSMRNKVFMPGADTVYLKRSQFTGQGISPEEIIKTAINSGELYDEEKLMLQELLENQTYPAADDVSLAVEFIKKLLPDTNEGIHLTEMMDYLYRNGIFDNEDSLMPNLRAGNIINVVVDDCEIKSESLHKSVMDMLIERIFELKQSGQLKCHVFFTIDEATSFDLSQKGAIVNLLLRQGRSVGISAILSSQFFTAENASNIKHALDQCHTRIAFDICDDMAVLRRFGIRADDKEKRRIIDDRAPYTFLAKGYLSTETSSVDYPIFGRLTREQVDEVRNYQK